MVGASVYDCLGAITDQAVSVIEAFAEANYEVLLEKAEEVIATMTTAPAC